MICRDILQIFMIGVRCHIMTQQDCFEMFEGLNDAKQFLFITYWIHFLGHLGYIGVY